MISVISAAVNISTSARKLFRNDRNFSYFLVCLSLVLSFQGYSFCSYIELLNLIMFLEH